MPNILNKNIVSKETNIACGIMYATQIFIILKYEPNSWYFLLIFPVLYTIGYFRLKRLIKKWNEAKRKKNEFLKHETSTFTWYL